MRGVGTKIRFCVRFFFEICTAQMSFCRRKTSTSKRQSGGLWSCPSSYWQRSPNRSSSFPAQSTVALWLNAGAFMFCSMPTSLPKKFTKSWMVLQSYAGISMGAARFESSWLILFQNSKGFKRNSCCLRAKGEMRWRRSWYIVCGTPCLMKLKSPSTSRTEDDGLPVTLHPKDSWGHVWRRVRVESGLQEGDFLYMLK